MGTYQALEKHLVNYSLVNFQIVVLEKTLENPLDCMEVKLVNPKGNQPWIFAGRTDAEAEPPLLWPPNVKSRLTGKDPDAGKNWRQEEKRMTEDEMVGWYHWLDGHDFEPGNSEGQGSLACCSPWDCKESDRTEGLNNNKIFGKSSNLEKAMAPHSSTLAWKIPWMEEPGGLQSMGSLSWTWLSNFTFTFHFHTLEKEMATHSSVLAWRIPGTGEPGGLPSMGSHRVGHDWSDLAA